MCPSISVKTGCACVGISRTGALTRISLLRSAMSSAQAVTVAGCYVAAFHVLILLPPGLLVDRNTFGLSLDLPQLKLCLDGYHAQMGCIEGSRMPHALMRVEFAVSSPSMHGENLQSL